MLCMTRSGQSMSLAPAGPYQIMGSPVVAPNIASYAQAESLSMKVFIVALPAVVMPARRPMSFSDEFCGPPAGSGGVVSGRIKGEAKAACGSNLVFMEGRAAVRMSDPQTHNNNNALGMVLSPPQTKVFIFR